MATYQFEEVRDLDSVWDELVALFEAFEEYNADFLNRERRVDWADRWREHLTLHDDRLILLVRDDGEAVGYLIASITRDHGLFEEAYAHISDVFLVPGHRRRGTGRRLLRLAEDWVRSRGVGEVRLEVFTGNKPAIRFWTLSGFGLDAMNMTKRLPTRGGT